MKRAALVCALFLTAFSFYRYEISPLYIVYLMFLFVPLITLTTIAKADLDRYNTNTWNPKKVKK